MDFGLADVLKLARKSRDVGTACRIEIQGRHSTEFSQGFAHRCQENGPNGLLILKFYLGLLRMDVYINVRGVYCEINKVGHLLAVGHQALVGCLNGFIKIRMTHEAPVHKEVLLEPFLARSLRRPHETGDLHQFRLYLQGHQACIYFSAEDIEDALLEITDGKVLQECLSGI